MPESLRKKGNIRLTSQERTRVNDIDNRILERKAKIKEKEAEEYVDLKVKDLLNRIQFIRNALESNKVPEHKKSHALELIRHYRERVVFFVTLDPTFFAKTRLSLASLSEKKYINELKEYAQEYYELNINAKNKDQTHKSISHLGFIAKTGISLRELAEFEAADSTFESYSWHHTNNLEVAADAMNTLYQWTIEFYKEGDLENSKLCLNELKDALITNHLFNNIYISSWLEVLDYLYEDFGWPRSQIGER